MIKEALFKSWDKLMDEGWKSFVDEVRASNDRSNQRLFRIISKLKGEDFVRDVRLLMSIADREYGLINVTRKTKGVLFKEDRFETIHEIWVDQKITDSGPSGYIYVQVKQNRFIKIPF